MRIRIGIGIGIGVEVGVGVGSRAPEMRLGNLIHDFNITGTLQNQKTKRKTKTK